MTLGAGTSLNALLSYSLHWLSPTARAAVGVLVDCAGRVIPAGLIAARVGLANRHQLARLFQREGLPCIDETAAWTQVLSWVLAWETNHTSLCRSALHSARDPAVCYRKVRRLTGRPWSEVRALGTAWVLLRLLDRCSPRFAGAQQRGASVG